MQIGKKPAEIGAAMNSRRKLALLLFFAVVLGLAHAINPQSASCPNCAGLYGVCELPGSR
jgi:hypothetical protein